MTARFFNKKPGCERRFSTFDMLLRPRQKISFWRGLLCALFLGATCAACSGPIAFSQSDRLLEIDSFYSYGAAGRDLRLVVIGDPFPSETKDVFDRRVEHIARRTGFMRQPTRPSLNPGPDAKDNYALVFVFQPPLTLGQDDLCAHKTKSGAPDASWLLSDASDSKDEVTAIAAFCLSGRALTGVSGKARMIDPDDPDYQIMIAMMMRDLFRPDIRPRRRYFP